MTVLRIHGDVHERTDDIHAGPPPKFEFFPVGLRTGVVLSLDIQTYCSRSHDTSDRPISCKGYPMPVKWIRSSRMPAVTPPSCQRPWYSSDWQDKRLASL